MAEKSETQQRFLDIMDKILPVVRYGTLTSRKITISGEEHEIPESALPVVFPVSFDTLSIVFAVDDGSHVRWLQNLDIEIAQGRLVIDDVLTKAYENLFNRTKDTIGVTRINEHTGMLTNCDTYESSFFATNEIWQFINQTLNAEDIIFAIPTQDIFIFCDARSTTDIRFLREKVNELFADDSIPKKISPRLYLRQSSGETSIYKE